MRRALGNQLIKLAYRIEPKLKAELNTYFQATVNAAVEQTADETVRQLLAHQQHTARIASMQ